MKKGGIGFTFFNEFTSIKVTQKTFFSVKERSSFDGIEKRFIIDQTRGGSHWIWSCIAVFKFNNGEEGVKSFPLQMFISVEKDQYLQGWKYKKRGIAWLWYGILWKKDWNDEISKWKRIISRSRWNMLFPLSHSHLSIVFP